MSHEEMKATSWYISSEKVNEASCHIAHEKSMATYAINCEKTKAKSFYKLKKTKAKSFYKLWKDDGDIKL